MAVAAAGWVGVCRASPAAAHEFYAAAAPVLLQSATLAQASFFLLFEWAEAWRPDPRDLLYALAHIGSRVSLVRYHAVCALSAILLGIQSEAAWRAAAAIVRPRVRVVIETVLAAAREYGPSLELRVVSRLVKEPLFVTEVAALAPMLTSAVFDLSAALTDAGATDSAVTAIGVVLNLVRCLRRHPEEENALCTLVFQRAMAALDADRSAFDQLIEVFALVVFYAPHFTPEFWRPFDIIEARDVNLAVVASSAVLARNLMMRDPARVRADFARFLTFGWRILDEARMMHFETVETFNAALFAIAEPNTVPQEYVAALCQLIPLDEPDCAQFCADNISCIGHFLLGMMFYNPAIPVQFLSQLITAWFELSGDFLCACATAFMAPVIDEERLASLLGPLLEAGMQSLTSEEEDTGREYFEASMDLVQARLIPVITKGRALQIFLQFLRTFEFSDSDLSEQVFEFLQNAEAWDGEDEDEDEGSNF
jgi:hypothetical protein